VYVQVGWWSEALSYSFLVFVFLESLKIFCQVWLLALVRLDQSPSCPRCLVLRPRRGRVCEAAQKVRLPFLSLNLSTTMNLFWSGEFCSGGKKKKENPAKPGAVPFFCLWTCGKLWICSGQVNFGHVTQKKTQKMVRGAYSVYFTNFHEICLLLCCFWQVGSATKKKGAKMIENEGRCWWRIMVCLTGGLTLRRGRFPFLFLNLLKTVDLFWSGKFWTGTMSWILHSKERTKKTKPSKKKTIGQCFPIPFTYSNWIPKVSSSYISAEQLFSAVKWNDVTIHSGSFVQLWDTWTVFLSDKGNDVTIRMHEQFCQEKRQWLVTRVDFKLKTQDGETYQVQTREALTDWWSDLFG